jgi:hypothetical protein
MAVAHTPPATTKHPWVSVNWAGPVTDAHLHVGDMPMFGVDQGVDGLPGFLADHGITTGIVIGADSGGNELVAEVVGKVPEVHGLVWADPTLPGAVAEVRGFLDTEGFCGVKLHPLLDGYAADGPAVWPVAEVALEYGVPVLVHCGHGPFSLPWQVERLATRYSQLKVIFAHMGHGTITYIDAAIEAAERHPNVWLETSGMPMGPKIREAVTRLGAARVMYGSDAPCHHPLAEQAKVLAAGLSEDELSWVLHRSAQQVFFGGETGR